MLRARRTKSMDQEAARVPSPRSARLDRACRGRGPRILRGSSIQAIPARPSCGASSARTRRRCASSRARRSPGIRALENPARCAATVPALPTVRNPSRVVVMLVPGLWSLVLGSWFPVSGFRFPVLGFLVPGKFHGRSVVPGLWPLVCGPRLSRHAQAAFADDVLLNLRGAAADDKAEREHELDRPRAAVDNATGVACQ